MNTSRNLLKLFDVTAFRKVSRWKDEGLGEAEEEDEEEEDGFGRVWEEMDSSSRSTPPMKSE